jgi:hypothetical protein
MTAFEASPYSLAQGDTVTAIVQAYNINGWGDLADPNPSGALIQVKPHQMADPIEGASIDEEQIELSWTALSGASTGGVAVASYHLQWDKATGGATWYDIQGFNPPSLATSTILTSEI